MEPGAQLGSYEIVALIGAGGMGEVYRARDTKLNREVALKVLPDRLAEDEERLARFKREAQVLAALNHPNIAQIYGLQDNALVMEYVPGEDLRGPLPLEAALPLARQIAEGLEYAHEKGIIHRDLKPANIKVTPGGRIKVLDFGLAKAISPDAASNDLQTLKFGDPGLSLAATIKGAIMGTPGYMSPEQARGETVDRRADIWAFGVVLFEMLAGKRLINEPTPFDAMAAVLKSNLNLTALPPETPPRIRRLIERCLMRDPRQRLQAIGEARIALDPQEEPATITAVAVPARRGGPPWRAASRAGWMVAAVATLALAVVSGIAWRAMHATPSGPLMRFSAEVGSEAALSRVNNNGLMALSPDGTLLAVVFQGSDGESRLGTRFLRQSAITPLANTEGGHSPFFSPDGQWIGFLAQGKLKKVSVRDGAVETICDAQNVRGASWGDDGTIVLSMGSNAPLSWVSSLGGTPAPLTKLQEGERTHRWPQVLPGSQSVLFTVHNSTGVYNDATIEAVSLATRERKVVVKGGFFGQYLPSGHLVYLHESTLFAAPFDLNRLTLSGPPAAILEDVSSNSTAGGDFAFSRSGIFVYLAGKAPGAGAPITWLDSAGKRELLYAPSGLCYTPRFSPDGKRLAFAMNSGQQDDIWVKDLDRGTPSRLTFRAGSNRCPVWTPDGQNIVFRSVDPNSPGLYWIRADGAGQPQRLTDGKLQETPYSFSSDVSSHRLLLAFQRADSGSHQEIWTAPIEGDAAHPRLGQAEPFLSTPFGKTSPAFSPDGHWLAYSSSESGTYEIYVRSFPGPGRKWQISEGGGRFPLWSRSGRELLFRKPGEGLQVVSYTTNGDTFTASAPRVWSSVSLRDDSGFPSYDLAPDGKRIATFLASADADTQKPLTHLTFLLNFFDEVRRKAPGKR
jgi:WD40 repeat protein/predicted Ser/Thr protein kinase